MDKTNVSTTEIAQAAQIILDYVALQQRQGKWFGRTSCSVAEIFARCAEEMTESRFRAVVRRYSVEVSAATKYAISYDPARKRENTAQGAQDHSRRRGLDARPAQVIIG